MAGSASTVQRRTSAETTGVILDAALHSVAQEGVDRSTLPVVAKRAGTSIGPLYSRFDNTDDLLAALWTTELRGHLHTLFGHVGSWLRGDDATSGAWLERELTRPSPRSQALLETMATVRRYPYSGDAVVADATAAHRAFMAAVDPIPEATAGYALAAVCGALLLHPLLAPKARTEPADLLRIVRLLVAERAVADVETDLVVTLTSPRITGGGEVPDLFLNAALEVIGRGGFEHASSTRIARAAGLSASRVYAFFESKDALAAQALSAIVDQVVGVNALAFVGVDEATYRRMVLAAGRALCDPAAIPVRRLRMECVLAARHHPAIHADTRRAFDRAERTVAETFRRAAPSGSDAALHSSRGLWHLVRNFGFGIPPIHEATGALRADLDLAPLATALPDVYRIVVLEPLGL